MKRNVHWNGSRRGWLTLLILLVVIPATIYLCYRAGGRVYYLASVLISGMAFGPEAGFLVGAVSGFSSNFLFGHGPWTPWQMFAFGTAGFLAGALYRLGWLSKKRLPLSLFGFFAVLLLVGPLLDTCALFTQTAAINWETAKAIYLSGVPINCIHGVATFLTLFFFSRPLFEKLDRVQLKYGMMEDGYGV